MPTNAMNDLMSLLVGAGSGRWPGWRTTGPRGYIGQAVELCLGQQAWGNFNQIHATPLLMHNDLVLPIPPSEAGILHIPLQTLPVIPIEWPPIPIQNRRLGLNQTAHCESQVK